MAKKKEKTTKKTTFKRIKEPAGYDDDFEYLEFTWKTLRQHFMFVLLLAITVFMVCAIVFHSYYKLPVYKEAKTKDQKVLKKEKQFMKDVDDKVLLNNITSFNEHIARPTLEHLVNHIGNRLIGSPQLDDTIKFLLERLETIRIESMQYDTRMQISVQTTSGSFMLEKFLQKDLLQIYSNLTNIVVRLSSRLDTDEELEDLYINTNETHSHRKSNQQFPNPKGILINSHYDSALSSPGASDDGIPTVVMLENIRLLLNTKELQLKRPLIFLFNGGEEFGMHAAHGFIDQHPWALEVAGIINLEAGGCGGKSILFQSGEGSGWIVDAYSTVPTPVMGVIANDIFKIVPSDTDYRVFVKHSPVGANGIDIAYYRNGFVYHTPQDDMNQIKPGSIQQMGENLHSMLLHLNVNFKESEETRLAKTEHIYVEFLHAFPVVLDREIAKTMAKTLILVLLVSYIMGWVNGFRKVPACLFIFQDVSMLFQLISIVIGTIVGLLGTMCMAALVAIMDKQLRFLKYPYIGFLMYGGAFISCFSLFSYIMQLITASISVPYLETMIQKDKKGKTIKTLVSTSDLLELSTFWAVILLYAAATLYLIHVNAYTFIVTFMMILGFVLPFGLNAFVRLPIYIRFIIGMCTVGLMNIQASLTVIELLLGYMNRLGKGVNPEMVFAIASAVFTLINLLPVLPYIHHHYHSLPLLAFIGVGFIIAGSLMNASLNEGFTKATPRRSLVSYVTTLDETNQKVIGERMAFGVPDSLAVHQALANFKSDDQGVIYLPQSPEQTYRDFLSAYPFSPVIEGYEVKEFNKVIDNEIPHLKPTVVVNSDEWSENSVFELERTINITINPDYTNWRKHGYTCVSLLQLNQGDKLHSWSLDDELAIDKDINAAMIRHVGQGEFTFTMTLKHTYFGEINRDKLNINLFYDVGCITHDSSDPIYSSIKDRFPDHVETIYLRVFQTNWNF